MFGLLKPKFCSGLYKATPLNLYNFFQITSTIVKIISNYCPSLEKVSFANCAKLTDQCIEFTTNLRRLSHLDISGCKKLTKLTEYALWKSPKLQTLHAVGLERLEMSIIMMFSKINTLYLYKCGRDYSRVDFVEKCKMSSDKSVQEFKFQSGKGEAKFFELCKKNNVGKKIGNI